MFSGMWDVDLQNAQFNKNKFKVSHCFAVLLHLQLPFFLPAVPEIGAKKMDHAFKTLLFSKDVC